MFTMADEARQTSQHDHSYWNENSKLRSKPVQFISAGKSEPLQEKAMDAIDTQVHNKTYLATATGHNANDQYDDSLERLEGVPTLLSISKDSLPGSLVMSGKSTDAESGGGSPFFFDITKAKPSDAGLKTPVVVPERELSPESDSSDEIILFQGRRNGLRQTVQTACGPTTPTSILQESTEAQEPRSSYYVGQQQESTIKREKKKARQPVRSVEDDVLADYIANMKENGELELLLDAPSSAREPANKSVISSKLITAELSSNAAEAAASSLRWEDEQRESSRDQINEDVLAQLIAQHGLSSESTGEEASSESSSDTQESERPRFSHARNIDREEFDPMDWDRPSLRRLKKGKRTEMAFGSSDTHLELQLQMAWKTDRQKKTERKRRREEMRELGLLHKKANPDDLRVKYPSGMSIQEVGGELRKFLQNEDEMYVNYCSKMVMKRSICCCATFSLYDLPLTKHDSTGSHSRPWTFTHAR